MQINRIELKNFKQYKDSIIKFSDGLIGFVGKNGSGKSTIFEAISNGFYGKFETNKDKIRNDKASSKDSVNIAMNFNERGKNYEVVRKYTGQNLTAKAVLFEEDHLIATGSQEVNKRIRRIIKIDYKNFKSSFFAHQKDVASLLNQSSKDRQLALRKMLGLERMDNLENKIKEEIKEQNSEINWKRDELLSEKEETEIKENLEKINREVKKQKSKLENETEILETVDRKYKETKKELTEIEKQKKINEQLITKIEVEETNIENNTENITNAELQLSQLNDSLKEHKKLLPKKEKYESLSDSIKILQENKAKFQQKEILEKSVETVSKKLTDQSKKYETKEIELKSFADIQEKIKKINKLFLEKKKILKALQLNLDNGNKILGSIKDRITESEEHLETIENIGKDSVCPTCERLLEDHYDILVSKYKKNIHELNQKLIVEDKQVAKVINDIKKIEDEMEKLNSQLSSQEKREENRRAVQETLDGLTDTISELNREISVYSKDLTKIGKIVFDEKNLTQSQKSLENLKPDYEKCLSLASKKDEIPKKEKEIKLLHDTKKRLDENLQKIKKEILELKYDDKVYIKLRNKREEEEIKLNEVKDRVHELEIELSETNSQIKVLEKSIKENENRKKDIEKLKTEIELFERLKITVARIKEQITSNELPQISASASKLFATITKGRYYNLRINDEFDFKVNRDDMEVDLETLSGGEKDLASLCLRIAISKRISKLAGRSNMGFLALDEVFGSLDEERREELLSMLHEISTEFKQIFIVSHNQDVQEEFPTCLLVSKVSGYSKAELILN
ncbi:MAG: SMC family ATPase [Ignavibacteriae bacterium]|nr:SMC family ATPase [Ignavibacteriota bacterium]